MCHKKQVMKNALTQKVASANPCWRASLFVAVAAIGLTFVNAALADTNLTESVVLAEDTDWRSFGTVTIPDGVGVHLNGHSLHVSGFTGAGSIYASPMSDYVVLDYIETDGTQYIDTGVTPFLTVKVDADIAYIGEDVTSIYVPLICASSYDKDNTSEAACYGVWVGWSGKWVMFYSGNRYNSASAVSANTRTHVVAAWSWTYGGTLSVNGNAESSLPSEIGAQPASNTMYLPGWNSGKLRGLSAAKFRIYSFKIYKDSWDAIVRDYIPVKRISDGAIGLYDCENNTFSPSATETPFIAGNEIGSTLGGELHIDIASGTTFTNATVAISNGVKVVKEGLGTYTSGKSQTYVGGTLVSAGRVKITSNSVLHGFGAAGSDVVVSSNAQVVIDGFYRTLSGYNVTIAGDGPDGNGAIYGNRARGAGTAWNSPFLNSLALAGDASIKLDVIDSFNLCSGNRTTIDVSLYGHRLTASGQARFLFLWANVTDAGAIVSAIAPGNDPTQNNFYDILGYAPLVDFEVAQGGALGGSEALVVSNMTFAGRWAPAADTKTITVLGCYSPKPTADNWPKITLGDSEHLSPTLDLSALSATYDGADLSFAEGATISVNLGDRNIRGNSRLVSWSSEPSNLFVRGDSVVAGRLEKKSDGLYFLRGMVVIVF